MVCALPFKYPTVPPEITVRYVMKIYRYNTQISLFLVSLLLN